MSQPSGDLTGALQRLQSLLLSASGVEAFLQRLAEAPAPQRLRSRSSMLSAPAAIPAMIADSFLAGFAPAEATRHVFHRTR
jgi:hypothetical protein